MKHNKAGRRAALGNIATARAFRAHAGLVAATLAVVLAGGVAAFTLRGDEPTGAALAAHLRVAFRLQSTQGAILDSRDLRGRPFLVFFGFTHCPAICSTTLAETRALLRAAGVAAPLYFITLDPERDTAEAMRDYVKDLGDGVVGLTGSASEIADAAAALRVFYARRDLSGDDYAIDHTAFVYLVNGDGEVTETLASGEPRVTALRKIRALAAGGL